MSLSLLSRLAGTPPTDSQEIQLRANPCYWMQHGLASIQDFNALLSAKLSKISKPDPSIWNHANHHPVSGQEEIFRRGVPQRYPATRVNKGLAQKSPGPFNGAGLQRCRPGSARPLSRILPSEYPEKTGLPARCPARVANSGKRQPGMRKSNGANISLSDRLPPSRRSPNRAARTIRPM